MTITRESFLLKRSDQFTLTTGAERRTDLSLSPNPSETYGIIVTIVMKAGPNPTPIANALVKILTPSGNPVDHNFTSSSDGVAASIDLPQGLYNVVASASGYLTSTPVTVNVTAPTNFLANISLSPDPRALQNTIYGLILDQQTGNRIPQALVTLTNLQGPIYAATTTDNDGEYLFCEIPNGTYTLTADKPGYALPVPITVTVSGSQIAQTDIKLVPAVPVNGTVQGFIKDISGNLLSGANVGLYSVTDTTETLLQITFTNQSGFYLFGGVPAGNYLVKAKVDAFF